MCASQKGKLLECLPEDGARDTAASAADGGQAAPAMACRGRMLFVSFLFRNRFLDEWLPNDLKRRRFTAVWNRGLCASVHTGTQ